MRDALCATLWRMIASFKHKGLQRFFEKDDSRKISGELTHRIKAILTRLNASEKIEDMNMPSYRLHRLKGNRKKQWSVTVKANWRVTFRFEEGLAFDVNLEDYH